MHHMLLYYYIYCVNDNDGLLTDSVFGWADFIVVALPQNARKHHSAKDRNEGCSQ